jgi:hypothetical protein
MSGNHPSNGWFPSSHVRFIIVAAALIVAKVTGGGPQDAMAVVSFAQFLLPPDGGRGPDRPTT